MKKEFGKLTRKQAREIHALYQGSKLDKEEYTSWIREGGAPDGMIVAWGELYELPLAMLEAMMLYFAGSLEKLLACVESPDPQQAFLDLVESFDSEDAPAPESEENKRGFLMALNAAAGNTTALERFGVTMKHLLDQAKAGDDEALFNAISVDPVVTSNPFVANRIALAQAGADKAFLNKLAAAIKGSRPHRPHPENDDLRFMIEVLAEGDDLANYSYKALDDLLCLDLELHRSDIETSYEALRKLIQRRNKKLGTSKGLPMSPTED